MPPACLLCLWQTTSPYYTVKMLELYKAQMHAGCL
jgi:hypothetical protein